MELSQSSRFNQGCRECPIFLYFLVFILVAYWTEMHRLLCFFHLVLLKFCLKSDFQNLLRLLLCSWKGLLATQIFLFFLFFSLKPLSLPASLLEVLAWPCKMCTMLYLCCVLVCLWLWISSGCFQYISSPWQWMSDPHGNVKYFLWKALLSHSWPSSCCLVTQLGFAFWQMWARECMSLSTISGTILRSFLTWHTSVDKSWCHPYFLVAFKDKKVTIIQRFWKPLGVNMR